MRIGIIADVHIGNHQAHGGTTAAGLNARCLETLKVLNEAMRISKSCGCETIIVAGDLFDTAKPSPQIIAATQTAFQVDGEDIPTHIIVGNHDRQSGLTGDHALGPLVGQGVHELPSYIDGGDSTIALLPFQATPANEWVPKIVGTLADRTYVSAIVLHAGIYTQKDIDNSPWDVTAGHDVIALETLRALQKKHNVRHIFAGNWHARRNHYEGVWQIGALVPTGWDNPSNTDPGDPYGSLLIYDNEAQAGQYAVETIVIPGPRFVQPKSLDELDELLARFSAPGFSVYVRMACAASDRADLTGQLEARRATHAQFQAFELRIDQESARDVARTSARIAGSQELLNESVGVFVESIGVPADYATQSAEFSAEVQRKVWEYLK